MLIHPRMLITDDDAAVRETLRGVFEPRGFRTLLASDGQEALEIVEREPVHLMLLDMHMPRLTGLETLRRLREESKQLPCILISGGLDDGIIREAQDARAFSVLPKPIRVRELTASVNEAMRALYNWPEASA